MFTNTFAIKLYEFISQKIKQNYATVTSLCGWDGTRCC